MNAAADRPADPAGLDVFYDDGTRICPIADALELVGDRWSLLVIREIGLGVDRFDRIQQRTGAPRQMLTDRLRKLETVGVLQRERYQEHPARYSYRLTRPGRELLPVLGALRAWGAEHAPDRRAEPSPRR